MTIEDMRVRTYAYTPPVHSWVVDEFLPYYGDEDPKGQTATLEVIFDTSMEIFACACRQKRVICDHILYVANFISRRSGIWEQDRVLMEQAWSLSTGEKKPDIRVERIKSLDKYERGGRFAVTDMYSNNTFFVESDFQKTNYECSCGTTYAGAPRDASRRIRCDHIQAVREFQANETPDIREGDPVYIGDDGKFKPAKQYATQGTPTTLDADAILKYKALVAGIIDKDLRGQIGKLLESKLNDKDAVYKFPKDPEKELKDLLELKEKIRKGAEIDQQAWEEQMRIGVDPAAEEPKGTETGADSGYTSAQIVFTNGTDKPINLEAFNVKLSKGVIESMYKKQIDEGEKAANVDPAVEEPKHKEPEPPKKPRSRFSEIDL